MLVGVWLHHASGTLISKVQCRHYPLIVFSTPQGPSLWDDMQKRNAAGRVDISVEESLSCARAGDLWGYCDDSLFADEGADQCCLSPVNGRPAQVWDSLTYL